LINEERACTVYDATITPRQTHLSPTHARTYMIARVSLSMGVRVHAKAPRRNALVRK